MNGIHAALGNDVEVVVLPKATASQPETVAQTLAIAGVDEPFLVKDSDNVFDLERLDTTYNYVCVDSLNSHDAINPRNKSYVQVDHAEMITNIREKEVISDLFAVGGYYFTDPAAYLSHYEKLADSLSDWHRELYISDVIGSMILDGVPFRPRRVAHYHDWGTIHEWRNELRRRRAFFVQLDGFLFERGSEFFEPTSKTCARTPTPPRSCARRSTRAIPLPALTVRPERFADMTERQLRKAGLAGLRVLYDCPSAAGCSSHRPTRHRRINPAERSSSNPTTHTSKRSCSTSNGGLSHCFRSSVTDRPSAGHVHRAPIDRYPRGQGHEPAAHVPEARRYLMTTTGINGRTARGSRREPLIQTVRRLRMALDVRRAADSGLSIILALVMAVIEALASDFFTRPPGAERGEQRSPGAHGEALPFVGSPSYNAFCWVSRRPCSCFSCCVASSRVLLKWQTTIVANSEATMASRLFDIYMSAPYLEHIRRNSAELIRNINSSVGDVHAQVVLPALTIFSDLLPVVIVVLVVVIVSPLTAVTAVVYFSVVSFVFARLISRRARRCSAASTRTSSARCTSARRRGSTDTSSCGVPAI